jgi:hypothetical protein
MVPAVDISQYQGNIDMASLPSIVVMKMSGGDNGLYFDADAATNYKNAKDAGKHVGGYHINGWVLGAVQEASWFLRAMSPKAENDVYCLDLEKSDVPVPSNGPQYVMDQINYLATQGITSGLLYMSLATLNAFDWSGPLSKWGLWLADWAVSPQANIPTTRVYVMQQYNDGPSYDHDEWFGTVEEFDKYGYHAPQAPAAQPTPTAAPTPAPQPAPAPAPSPSAPAETTPTPATDEASEPVPAPVEVSEPVPPTTPATAPVQTVVSTPVKLTFWDKLVALFTEFKWEF